MADRRTERSRFLAAPPSRPGEPGRGDPSLFLTPREAPREAPRDRREGGADPPAAALPGGRARPAGGRRRVVAAGVAAALLVAGVVADRSSREDPAAPEGAPGTSPVGPGPMAATGPHGPVADDPTPAVLETSATLGPRLPAPTGTTVVVVARDQVAVADLDSGVVRTARLRPAPDRSPFQAVLGVGSSFLLAGSAPLVVPRAEGAVVDPLDLPVFGGYLPSARAGAFWTVDQRFDVELVEQTLTGASGRRVVLPGESGPVLPVGDGFIVSPAGSIMSVDATTGRVDTLGEGTAVAYDGRTLVRSRCGEDLECGLVLSDLDGGREREVGPPTPRSRYDTYAGARFSPDGRWLSIPFYGEDQPGGLALIDVERGERRPTEQLVTASGGGFPASAAFTADSRWLLFADRSAGPGSVHAVDLADGSVRPLELGPAVSGGDGDLLLDAFPSIPADSAAGG